MELIIPGDWRAPLAPTPARAWIEATQRFKWLAWGLSSFPWMPAPHPRPSDPNDNPPIRGFALNIIFIEY